MMPLLPGLLLLKCTLKPPTAAQRAHRYTSRAAEAAAVTSWVQLRTFINQPAASIQQQSELSETNQRPTSMQARELPLPWSCGVVKQTITGLLSAHRQTCWFLWSETQQIPSDPPRLTPQRRPPWRNLLAAPSARPLSDSSTGSQTHPAAGCHNSQSASVLDYQESAPSGRKTWQQVHHKYRGQHRANIGGVVHLAA